MIDLIAQVVETRDAEQLLKNELKRRQDAFDASIAELRQRLNDAQAARSGSEIVLRETAIDRFRANGDKNVAPGVKVKIFTELNYDPQLALDYCKRVIPLALKLDAKKFEAIAKDGSVPFVNITKTPSVHLAGFAQ